MRKRIGYLPENVPLYTDIPVEAHLLFVAEVKGVAKQDRKRTVEEIMERCGIAEVAHRYVGNLSKGYRQRVGIAQALVGDPEVLILDEPTLGLDPKQIVEIRKMIKDLATDKTVILSTHILPEVSMTCERVVIINEGQVVAEDTPENLTSQLQGPSRISLQIEGPKDEIISGLKEIPGVIDVEFKGGDDTGVGKYLLESEQDNRREVAKEIIDRGWGLLELKPVGISLEDVFVQLVTEEEK